MDGTFSTVGVKTMTTNAIATSAAWNEIQRARKKSIIVRPILPPFERASSFGFFNHCCRDELRGCPDPARMRTALRAARSRLATLTAAIHKIERKQKRARR